MKLLVFLTSADRFPEVKEREMMLPDSVWQVFSLVDAIVQHICTKASRQQIACVSILSAVG